MKKLLLILALLVSPFLSHASPADAISIWEKAAYGTLPGVTHVLIQGWNPAVTTTFEDVSPESSALAIPVAALSSPYCASTDVDDDAADTGAITLSLTVVKTDFVETVETLALDGQTSASLATTSVLGFNDVRVATAGATGGNEGVVDCGTGTNTGGSAQNAYATIGAYSVTAVPAAGAGAANVAQVFQYIVPAGYKLICRNVQVGSVFATAAAGLDAVIDGSTNLGLIKRYWTKMIHNTGANPSLSPELLVFPEKTYLKGKVAGVTGTLTGPVSMGMECLKISNAVGQSIF